MGEYYEWVNVDKRAYISPGDFGYGNKLSETARPGNGFLRALRELIEQEWAGDHILFMGDEKPIPANAHHETLKTLYRHTLEAGCPGDGPEAILEKYRNISCLFRDAKPHVRPDILLYLEDEQNGVPDLINAYGIDVSKPFEGLFLKEGKDFPFTVNCTKKVCYSLGKTKICDLEHQELDVDPLPFLMCYGLVNGSGDWLGDIIGVAEDMPSGVQLLDEIDIDW